MNFRSVGRPGYLLGLFVALLLLCGRTDAAENHLVRGGKAECVVVVEPKAGEFYGFSRSFSGSWLSRSFVDHHYITPSIELRS